MSQLEQYLFANKKSRLEWLYWEPKQDSILHEFFSSSVIHGLKYVSRRKLSVFERLFWIGVFIASAFFSYLMISQVWERYHRSPVIVTFTPTEQETSKLPFPAVTICNKGLFSSSKIRRLFQDFENGINKNEVMEKLRLVNSLCSSKQSFLRRVGLIRPDKYSPEWSEVEKEPSQKTLEGAVKFIHEYTHSCHELVKVCSWDNKRQNCSDLFKPIVTDYGKCCTANKLPSELMRFEKDEVDGVEREVGWSYSDILEWKKWNYEDGFTITDDTLKFPLRQKRAGSMYGLSVLIDPDVGNGYCQSQDSYGIRVLLDTPLDMPRITHLGSGFGAEKEIFLKVFPDSTIADDQIADYPIDQRKCIFGRGNIVSPKDETLDMQVRPYSRSNCYLVCQQKHILDQCNCTLFYTKRRDGIRICNPSARSKDRHCLRQIERSLSRNLKNGCTGCLPSCNYLKYNMEASEATLLDPEDLWGDNETGSPPPWSIKKLSIIHIFMGADVNVPKLRQKLYRTVDLIASIGGLLGLTMGFSVLAAVEVIYLLTLRVCCKRYREMGEASQEVVRPDYPYMN